jgi:hypothetical protein
MTLARESTGYALVAHRVRRPCGYSNTSSREKNGSTRVS